MTNGGFIFFNSKKDKNFAFNKLNKLISFDKKIFYLKQYKSNKLFYKINLKAKKSLEELIKDLNKVSVKKYFIENLKVPKHKKVNNIDVSKYLLKNIKFIKITGVHRSEGVVLFDNFEHLNKITILENHKIFKLVCKHFEKY